MEGKRIGRLRLLVALLAALVLAMGPGCIIYVEEESPLNGKPVLRTCSAEKVAHVDSK